MSDLITTVAGLSAAQRAALEAHVLTPATPVEDPGLPVTDPGPRPVSLAQRRLWFLDQLEPGNPAYHLAYGWRVHGRLDITGLAEAYRRLVARHEALTTVFRDVDGEPLQHRAGTAAPLRIRTMDVLDPAARDIEVNRIAAAFAAEPFDLATGPLIRAEVLVLDGETHHLLLAVHHIVADGHSIGILLDDLLALYRAESQGTPVALPALSMTPHTYVAEQHRRLASDSGAGSVEYWRQRLRDLPDDTGLATDRTRPRQIALRGDCVTFHLDRDLTARLSALARSRSATTFAVLLAGLSAVLARHTGRDDVVIGTPVSDRRHSAMDTVVGLFLNTIVLRVDVATDPTFAALIRHATEVIVDGYDHQEVPFELLVNELSPQRQLGRNPLYQVMLALDNTPVTVAETAGVRLVRDDPEMDFAKVDLSLHVLDTGGELRCDLRYAADLFDRDRVVALAGHIETLVRGAVANPDLRVSDLPMLSAAEHASIAGCNDTGRVYHIRPLPDLVDRQAAATPHRPAVGFDHEWIDYATFIRRRNRLARRLIAAGVRIGDVVGVCLDRGIDLVVALHAVQAAGAAYLPLDPQYPAERVAYLITDSGARLVLTGAAAQTPVPAGTARLDVRTPDDQRATLSADPVGRDIPLDANAYVIYTSGSTGQPKGVAVSHRSIANRLAWMQDTFRLGADDRVLQKTPFSFDVSVWEFFWPLLAGAGLVVAAPDGHRDTGYLVEIMAAERVTVTHFVPSMLDSFLDEPDLDVTLPALRAIIASGEALRPEQVTRARAALPGVALHNLYGPTEAAVDVSWQPCADLPAGAPVPIGRPVANTRLEVLDARATRLPTGAVGELCIGGVQLATGYLGRPRLTAQRFVPDPYGTPGSRLYRTGDLAIRRPDGALEYRGRDDHQVKLNGFRIELGEIEARLAEQPDIRAAVVLARDDGHGQYLVAYVVTGAPVGDEPDWSQPLSRSLPAFMIPSRYVVLEEFPLTGNGKLDRAALPVPGRRQRTPARRTGLDTPTERVLAAILTDVLGAPDIGADDDFFALGGDSMRSLKVVARLRAAGYQLRLQDLFTHPRVRDLAGVMRHVGTRAVPATVPSRASFALLSPADMARLAARTERTLT